MDLLVCLHVCKIYTWKQRGLIIRQKLLFRTSIGFLKLCMVFSLILLFLPHPYIPISNFNL